MKLEDRIYDLMRRLERAHPDDDPGDLSITWQDDSKIVSVDHGGHTFISDSADKALDDLITWLASNDQDQLNTIVEN